MLAKKMYYRAIFFSLITLLTFFLGCEKMEQQSPTAIDNRNEVKSLTINSLTTSSSATLDIIVTTTSDVVDFSGAQQIFDLPGPDGVVSLREAIIAANYTSGPQTIGFNIPTNDPEFDGTIFTIKPTNSMPHLTDGSTHINGATQTAFSGNTNNSGPEIKVDFSIQGDEHGFIISSDHNSINSIIITQAQVTGINITGSSATDNRVTGCFIVENGTGQHGGEDGICIVGGASNNIIGGPSVTERNIISSNIRVGIIIAGDPTNPDMTHGNIVIGNFIGTDNTGIQAWPNAGGGVLVFNAENNWIGGFNPGEGNLISGNSWTGIVLGEGSSSTIVAGNLIGTDVTGAKEMGNNTAGIVIRGDASFENASHDNIIGGSDDVGVNIISGNQGQGVFLWRGAHHNKVMGNLIGTDITGTKAIGNRDRGVLIGVACHDNIIGGYDHYDRNIISANGLGGVEIQGYAYHNYLFGNYIGTDQTASPILGNAVAGIRIRFSSYENFIGSNDLGIGNIIAGNDGPGITVSSNSESYGNRINFNLIYSNTGLGIDLNADDVTPNDPGDLDTGPNNLMNYPVLTSAKVTSGKLHVKGTIDTQNPKTVTIEFFANPVPNPCGDPSGYGEGAIYVGSDRPNPHGKINATLPTVAPGTLITATATDAAGNTSEFSAYIEAK